MKRVKIDYNLVGSTLAEDVFSDNGNLLLTKGCKLKKLDIIILLDRGVDEVLVDDKELTHIDPEFLEVYNEGKANVERIFSQIRNNETLDLEYTYKFFDDIKKNVGSNINYIKQLVALKELDGYTAQHSLNVGILSIMLANLMGLDEEEIILVGYGGLLHDVGKALIPDNILLKPGKLTDEEFSVMKNHPQYGYDLLKKNNIDKEIILSCALMHHEKIDGTGYPRGLKGDQIHIAAQIVTVADIFDAVTSERVYKGPNSLLVAYTEIKDLAFKEKINPSVAVKFLERLSDIMEGRKILLGDGSIGKLIKAFMYDPHKSLIEVNGEYIDLNKETSLSIEKFID